MNLDLRQGWCGDTDFEWRGKTQTEDGTLYFWIQNEGVRDVPPLDFQEKLLHETVQNWKRLKRTAVAYVRDRMRASPEEYGLEAGEQREDGGPDWLNAGLDEFLQDFKLRQIGIPAQSETDQIVYLAFETHMDLENSCAVELSAGQPVRENMAAGFGAMLILESEAYPAP